MIAGIGSVRQDFFAHPDHGPLPAMLLTLTVATGVIDAVSIIGLGRVFVANMTGNVAFIGFALAGAPGFSLTASLIALAGFLTGAGIGGAVIGRLDHHRAHLLSTSTTVQTALLAAATIVTAASTMSTTSRDIAVALAATALGLQNAVARRLAIPDMTTTVLTMTLTGIAADLRAGNLRTATRRICVVLALLAGALSGALLVLHVSVTAGLAAATSLVALVAASAITTSRTPAHWHPRPR